MKKLISFFDRKFNLFFFKDSCFTLEINNGIFEYNDIINDGQRRFRCLGKNQYKTIK